MKFEYTKERPLRVCTTFSGYDSQCMALDRIGIPYELVAWSEIDKYAIAAHNAVYPQWADRNLGDITKVDWDNVPDFDLFTYSSPCQDFSTAGLQKGGQEGSGTRSSLLWECKKAILAKRPKYLLQENVKGLVSQKFIHDFRRWEQQLAGLGYENFCKVLNATDFNVPQHRERVFMVSCLDNTNFRFPEKIRLERRLKDVLEPEVGEKYYLSAKRYEKILAHGDRKASEGCGFAPAFRGRQDISTAVTTIQDRGCNTYIVEDEQRQQANMP